MKKVIKMQENKKGKEEFLVKWVGYPLSPAMLEPGDNISVEKACQYYLLFFGSFSHTTCTHHNYIMHSF